MNAVSQDNVKKVVGFVQGMPKGRVWEKEVNQRVARVDARAEAKGGRVLRSEMRPGSQTPRTAHLRRSVLSAGILARTL